MAAKRIAVAEGNCRITIKMTWPKGRSMSMETRPEGIPDTYSSVAATKLAFRLHCGSPPQPKVTREQLMSEVSDGRVKKLLSSMSDDLYAALLEE